MSTRWPPILVALSLLLSVASCKGDKDGDGEPKAHPTTAAPAKPADEAEHNAVKLSPDAIAKYGVKSEPVTKHGLTETFSAPGRVAFNTEAIAHVGSAVKGRVWELKVKLGDTVAKDAALLIVESPELGEAQSDYLQRRTAVTAAQALIDPAKAAYERAKSLQEKSESITLTEVQKRESDYRTATGALESAKAALSAAENKLRLLGLDQPAIDRLARSGEINPRSTLRAPIAGQVIERTITQGELVSPDKESLLTLADLSTVYVLADIPEARLADVKQGAPATLRIAIAAAAAAAAAAPLHGKVSFISPTINPATRTAEVRIEVGNDKGELRPGMFAQVEIAESPDQPGQKPKPVLAVPDDALLLIEGHPCVFVPGDAPNAFAKREVKTGRTVGDLVEILSGLKEGEQVVTSGASILKAELTKPAKEEE